MGNETFYGDGLFESRVSRKTVLNLLPFVAVVNFEPKQTLTCQNMSETKSIRRRNLDDSKRPMQAFKVKFGNL